MNKLTDLKKINLSKIGYFRFKKFDQDRYLITGISGEWSFLNKSDFNHLITGNIDSISKEKQTELSNKNFIKDKSYQEKNIKKLIKKTDYLNTGPSLHIIVLTLRCNHKCRYCHASIVNEDSIGKDLSLENAKNIVDTIFFSSSNSITIEFQGGEPLLNFEVLKYIVEYSKQRAIILKKNLNFALVTNMSLMDKEKLKFIVENNIGISTSLDGDEITHNYNRLFKKGNSFKEVVKWIKIINEEFKKYNSNNRVGALTTVTKKTLTRYKELIDTFVEIGLDSIFLRPLNPYGFASKNLNIIGYTYNEFNDFYNNSINYIIELNKKGINLKENFTSIYLKKVLSEIDPNFLDERSPCGAGIGQVAYNYDGKIYTCDEARMFGAIKDDSFLLGKITNNAMNNYKNIIDNDVTKSMINASILDSKPGYIDDVYKTYIGICPIYNYKKNSNIFANYSLDNRLKIAKNILDFIFKNIEDKNMKIIFNKWINN